MKVIVIRSIKDYVESELTDKDFINSGIVYCRVSTVSQIDGNSLDIQQNKGIEFYKNLNKTLEEKNKKIIVFREEGKSGDDFIGRDNEIVLRQLLTIILSKVDSNLIKHFWVLDNSRLSRNTDLTSVIHKKLRQNKVKFYESGVERNLDDLTESMFMKILSVFDEYENHKRFQKSTMGKIESLRKNKWIGGTYPFGYTNGKEKGEIVVDPKQKKYVIKMFEMCRDKKSTKDIVLYLNKENVKSPKTKSGVWNEQTIRNMLRSTKYIGLHIVEQKLDKHLSKEECKELGLTVEVKQKFPKIVDNVLFNEVQKITEQWNSNKNSQTKTKYNYLINELVYCGHCGNKMKINTSNKRKWKVYFCDYSSKKYSDFDNRYVKCGKGISKYIHLDKLELLVWEEVLKTYKNSYQIKESFKNSVLPQKIEERNIPKQKIEDYRNYIKTKYSEINKIKRLKEERKTDVDLSIITKKEHTEILKKYDSKIEELQYLISKKESDIIETQNGINWYDWTIDFEKHYNEIKDYKSFKERQSFISKHINRVEIKWNKNNNTHKITIHFNIPIVKDERINEKKYTFKIMEGKNEKVINNFSHLFLSNITNHFSKTNNCFKTTQQLLNSFESKNLSQNPLLFDSCERFNLSFNLNIRSSKLTKTSHYNPYQYKLYRLIKFLKEERGIGYRRISHILYDKGFRSVRTNSILKYNYVYSIYYKGKIRENRINRNFESEITDVKLLYVFY